MKNLHNAVLKPVISEKSFQDASRGMYTFLVNNSANKNEIREAIEKIFSVNVVKIATDNVKKTRNINKRMGKVTKDIMTKKARVTLKKGEKIDLFEEESTTA